MLGSERPLSTGGAAGFCPRFGGRRPPIQSSFPVWSLSELVGVGFREATFRLLGGVKATFVVTASRRSHSGSDSGKQRSCWEVAMNHFFNR